MQDTILLVVALNCLFEHSPRPYLSFIYCIISTTPRCACLTTFLIICSESVGDDDGSSIKIKMTKSKKIFIAYSATKVSFVFTTLPYQISFFDFVPSLMFLLYPRKYGATLDLTASTSKL